MTDAVTGNAPASIPGAGAVLLAERRRQGLSLGDIARQLKLSVRQVEAIERDDFSALEGPVFVHGFIRNYAKLLALDPTPLIVAADALLGLSAKKAPAQVSQTTRMPAGLRNKSLRPVYAGVVLLLLVVVIGFLGRQRGTPQALPIAESVSTPGPDTAKAAAPAQPGIAESRPSAAVAPRPPGPGAGGQGTRVVSPAALAKPTSAANAGVPPPAAPAATSRPDAGRLVVRMVFEQESWVEIKDRNGNVVFGQLNQAGTRRSAGGEPPLDIVIGNAAGVSMFKGDTPVDLAPHTRVDVARFRLE